MKAVLLALAVCLAASAQDTTAILEGRVTDATGGVVSGAVVRAVNTRTGYTREQIVTRSGAYHVALPVGEYDLQVRAPNFAVYLRPGLVLEVSQTARMDVQLRVAKEKDVVTVTGTAATVDAGSNVIGNVVTGRELVDLPLNGRNFTQLGLLQPGVAPLTAGLALGRRVAAGRPGVCGERTAPGIEQLPARWRHQCESRRRRLRAEDSGGRHPGVPNPHPDRAGRVRRNQRRDHHRRYSLRQQ